MFPVASLISTYSGHLDLKSSAHKPERTYTRLDYTFNVKIEKNAEGQNNLYVLVEQNKY